MFNNLNWNNQGYGYQQSNTNIVYVTGPEEAVMRATNRGSDEVFFDQSKAVFYRVKVDYDGRKTWAAFTYTADNPATEHQANSIVTREDFDALVNEVKELRDKVLNPEVR